MHNYAVHGRGPLREDEAGYWFWKGNEFLKSSCFQKAAESFDKAIQINPKDAEAWNLRGLALASQNRFEEAFKSFDKACSMNPSHPDAWHNKGVALARLGLDAEARFAFSCAGWIGLHGGV
jgi:Flp pilus assembly protein TadD